MGRDFDWYSDAEWDAIRSWPRDVQTDLGNQIRSIQDGEFPRTAKWWKDVGEGVIQLKAKGYRVIVTIALAGVVICIYAFEKDSRDGSRTREQHKRAVRTRMSRLVAITPSRRKH